MTAACPACATAPLAFETSQVTDSNLLLSLPTIHCAVCIGKIETALRATPGVSSARVNISLRRVSVKTSVEPVDIVDKLASIGFEAYPLHTASLSDSTDTVTNDLLIRLAVAGFAMMNVMLFSVAVWSGASDATRDLFHLLSASIAIPVVAYSAQPFFKNAWSALRAKSLNMDVPISLAIILAAGMSLFETLHGGRHAYFDAALSLTFFLLIGRYLDQRTRGAARSAASELAALEEHTARRVRNGKAETISIQELRVGDEVLVPTGVRSPIDGRLNSRSALTDRSFITGESEAVEHQEGESLVAGEINLGAPFRIIASAVGEDTTLRRVAALVENAERAKNKYTALADRAAQIYAPAVHLLALGAFLGWMVWDGDLRHALNVAIAVLIITCPCALGLAVPAVSSAAIGKLYQMGFLVKSGTALERLAETDTVIFDKTGTLTLPGRVSSLAQLSDDNRSILVALTQSSAHPVSKELAAELKDYQPIDLTDVREVVGKGVEAIWRGQPAKLGRGGWIGASFSGLGLQVGERRFALDVEETLRPGCAEAVEAISGMGFETVLLSGDKCTNVETVASALKIDRYEAGVTAEEKHSFMTTLNRDGHRSAMIGDGLNDTASLAAADASIAPSTALDASRNVADIVVLRDSFEDLPKVFAVARKFVRLSRQNFALATAYNLIAIPIAVAGFATPLLAALAMSASSLTVLINALRVRRLT